MKLLFDPRKPHFSVWTRLYDPLELYFLVSQNWRNISRSRVSLLHHTSLLGLRDVVEFLVVGRLQDVNSRDAFDNLTPLFMASRKGHLEVSRILLQFGADANARDLNGRTPLHLAVQSGCLDIIQFLLEHGADANAQDKYNRTPLHPNHTYLGFWNPKISEVLLKRGMDPNARDKHGQTLLYSALARGHLESAQVLLEHGADVNALDNNNPRTKIA